MRTTILPLLVLTIAACASRQEPREAGEILVIGQRVEDGVPVVPKDAVGSRNVFGPDEIREKGSRDINDLVQHIPAISTRPYNGGEASAPNFSMRGLPDDGLTEYVNVMIDGVPASPLPYGWTAFSFLPVTPDRLWAVDYLRGAHSVRYSPNTVGGILNFITQPIPSKPTASMRGTFGDFGYSSWMLSAGGTTGDIGLLGTYVDRRGDGYRDMGGFEQNDVNLKFRWDIDDTSWLAASGSYMDDFHKAPGGLTQAEFAQNRFGNSRPENAFDGDRTVLDVLYHRDLEGNDYWEAFGYFSKTMRHLRAQRPHFGTPDTVLDWTDDSYFWAVGARATQTLCIHTLHGGIRFHREWMPSWKIDSEPFPGGPGTLTRDTSFEMNTLSLHIDDTMRLTDRLTVQVGARMEWVPSAKASDDILGFEYDDTFFKVLPGVGASYTICDNATVFGNYFEGFRAPQAWGFGSAVDSDSLDFEEGTSAELGVRGGIGRGTGVTGAITGWRTEYDNFGVFFTGFYENLGNILAQGVDFEVEWDAGTVWESLDGFSITGSLTVQDSELKSGPDAGNQTPYAWQQKAAWWFRYRKHGWSAGIGGTFVGESFSDSANTEDPSADGTLGVNPSRVLWDARVAKRAPLGKNGNVEFAIGATNLFDKEWYVHSRGGFFGGGLVAGPPLQFYASLDLIFNW